MEAQENWSGLLVQPVITAREAVDDDCNGQIDHIKIITDQNLDDDFSGLTLTVTGYMLDASPYLTNIGLDGNNDNVFYVKLVEGVTPDTDGTPAVTVTANVTLSEFGGSNNIAVDTTMVIEAENFNTNVSLDTPALHLWTFQTTPTFGGFSGTGYMRALPDDGANCGSNHTTCGAEMTYNFVLATAGIYAVTFRWEADSAGDDSVQWGADGVRAAKNINPDGVFGSWVSTTGNYGVNGLSLTAGAHVLDVWMREAGARVDQITIGPGATAAGACTNFRSIGTAPPYSPGAGVDVTATLDSAIVTGTGTAWLTENRGRGDHILINGTDEYTILSVDSETQLTMTSRAIASTTGPHTISRQFATLQAWEDCIDGGPCSYFPVASPDLVADDRIEVGVAYNDAPFTDPLVISGATTDASHPIMLTAAVRNRHRGVAGTGVVIDLSTGAQAIAIEDDFVTVEWLEVTGDGGGSANGLDINNQNASNQIVVRNNIIHDGPRDGIELLDGNTKLDFYNNILYNLGRSGMRFTSAAAEARIFNNTVYNCASIGVAGSGTALTDLRNNIAHSNFPSDFALSPISGTSSNNSAGDATGVAHSPLGGGMDNVPLANFLFISMTPGTEDFHIIAGSTAEDAGTDLSSFFLIDIDGANRSCPWDIGADDIVAGGAPRISSAFVQSFTVGDPDTPAAVITITEDFGATTMTAVKDLRIRIPAGFNMRWDSLVPSVTLGGSAFAKVDPTIKGYEDLGRTVVLDVTADFAPGDVLTISGLQFTSFVAPSPFDNLELEVANDGLASAFDDKTIAIGPSANPNLSSFDHQFFTVGPGPSPAEALFISEGAVAAINAFDDICIHIPGSLAMEWNTTLTSAIIGGNAASKVSTTVSYAGTTILIIDVTAPFAAGEFISVSGLEFVNLVTPGVGNLELEVDNAGGIVGFDDKVIAITDAAAVPFFAATATNNQVKLEWVNPFFGACDNIHIVRNIVKPTGPFDGLFIDVRSCVALLGVKQDVIDGSAANGTKYHYAIFVEYGGAMFTAGKFLQARPFNSLPGPVKWAYSTGAASMAPPGLRFFSGVAYVYAVSNDGVLHSVNGGGTGGDWPAGWIPSTSALPRKRVLRSFPSP